MGMRPSSPLSDLIDHRRETTLRERIFDPHKLREISEYYLHEGDGKKRQETFYNQLVFTHIGNSQYIGQII